MLHLDYIKEPSRLYNRGNNLSVLSLGGLESGQTLLESVLVLAALNNLELAVLDVVNDTVQFQLALVHGINDSRVHSQNLKTAQDVVLTETQSLALLCVELLQLLGVLHSKLTHGLQPNVQQSQSGVSESGVNTTAAGVAADEDVLNLQVCDGEFNDGERVDVGCGDDVGNVAVDKDLTGLQAEDGRFGNARVGAANPKNLGRLALSGFGEEIGVGVGHARAPVLNALGESVGEAAC